MPIRIDAHTHVFPDEIAADRASFCARDGWFRALYENSNARIATVEDLVESMEVAGIDHSVICGFPWRDPGLCSFHNDYMHSAVDRFPGRLSWLGIVSPEFGNQTQNFVGDLFSRGASGLGEFNADAQGFDLCDSRSLADTFRTCIEAGRPVMIHVSEPVGHHYPGKGTSTPDRFLRFVADFPELRIVAAHWGGGLPFYELMPEVREISRNIVYDSAASTYLYAFEVFRSVIDLVGQDRVLFASDFPVLRQDRFVRRVSALAWKDAGEESAVMAGNAARVYGIDSRKD